VISLAFIGRDILIVAASYGVGCFTAGYYLFRWRTGRDIREVGSGNPGARNVGRLLGPGWFVVTLLLDSIKGALAVGSALYFGLSDLGVMAAMLATVSGHIWPLQLCFRGGKGVAASLGAAIVYTPIVTAIVLPVFVVLLALLRNLTLSGLLVFVLAPGIALLASQDALTTSGLSALAVLVLFAHRRDIRGEIRPRPTQAQ